MKQPEQPSLQRTGCAQIPLLRIVPAQLFQSVNFQSVCEATPSLTIYQPKGMMYLRGFLSEPSVEQADGVYRLELMAFVPGP
jgi:hypothetical protein